MATADRAQQGNRHKYELTGNETLDTLKDWAHLMTKWAKDARDDIIRLEAAMGMPPGDPGDPPSWPPE